MNRTGGLIVRRTLLGLLLIAALVLVIGPLLWSLSTSLKPTNEILSAPPLLIPDTVTGDHYARLVREGVGVNFWNSMINAISTVVVALIVGTAAGYALSRYRFTGSKPMLLLFVAAMTIPAYSLLLPTQVLFDGMGLLNTAATLPILYSAHAIPLVVWVTKTQFDALPIELEQAAAVDGYSRWESVRKIVLPGAKPALIAGAAYAFLVAWNDYITAATMTSSPQLRTLPVALIFYQGFSGREWGPLMAGVVIATIPPVVLFIVFRRYLIGGFLSGAIKG
ncbi:MAG: carbohydrate ABC transporter permease [Microbacteriaceae bacterium]|uniref:carbohydrate ABC transporter permease n=1 Tax=Microbacterium sp. JB110 TaxID=2024477 RepID=UPI00097E8F72|nr:carbohydrate ABC transporter permease [Microbacterium sp. JB110]RCS58872.1 carbohydrate ABC transporter permease [Microbacterium sp. JB110]SJM55302.1 ABC-type sugar transport system, permease component [Frigoribacterium sp. JB110]